MTLPESIPADSPGFRLDARWVIPIEPYGSELPWHSVVVRDGRIDAVSPTDTAARAYPDLPAVDLRDQILLPGLVNAHTHAAMSLLRGFADDMVLKEWLETRIWPAEAKVVDADFVADGTRLACLEMLLGGVTAFADMYFHVEEAIAAAVGAGMRINAGLVYITVPTRYARTEDEYLQRGLAARESWQRHPLVSFSLAPHATYSTTPESMDRIRSLSADYGLGFHTHLHETAAEVTAELADFSRTGVQRLGRAGALGPGFFGAHGIHVDDADIELLAETGSAVVHCPSSNMKLASGFAPVGRMLAAGVTVALGTDGAASNNRLDLWQEMRTAALLAKAVAADPAVVPAHAALRMATLSGARALGLAESVGSLVPGKQADIVAVDLSSAGSRPLYDPASHLVYALGRDQVRNVWVAGRRVVADGTCTTLDDASVLARADGWAEELRHL